MVITNEAAHWRVCSEQGREERVACWTTSDIKINLYLISKRSEVKALDSSYNSVFLTDIIGVNTKSNSYRGKEMGSYTTTWTYNVKSSQTTYVGSSMPSLSSGCHFIPNKTNYPQSCDTGSTKQWLVIGNDYLRWMCEYSIRLAKLHVQLWTISSNLKNKQQIWLIGDNT